MEKEEGKYFYCAIMSGEEKRFGKIGMENSEVYTIPHRDIAAVVSDSPMMDYELSEDNTRKHEEVIRQVMNEYSVLPTEFGTVIKNKRILKRLLKKAYGPTKDGLKTVDNMLELGVKAVQSVENVFADAEKTKEYAQDILESLKAASKQTVVGDLFSRRLILNASFLVDKNRVDAFSDEVEKLQCRYPTLKFLYSGPWAPHNFVYIKIGASGVEIKKIGESECLFL
jgi:hypothetical protein